MSNIEQFKARDMMYWEDKDDQDKMWVHFQIYFKKLWTQKTRYSSGYTHKYINDFLMACCSAIRSAGNTLKTITAYSHFHTEFSTMYYNDIGDVFRFIF